MLLLSLLASQTAESGAERLASAADAEVAACVARQRAWSPAASAAFLQLKCGSAATTKTTTAAAAVRFPVDPADGADEQATVFDGLARQGKLRTFVDQLAPTDAERLTRWLDEHTVLLGDCGDCPGADARAVLRVPRSRCEVCGGSDIRREARRFVDACLNHGTTRVTIVGGSPKYHRQLRELVQHRVLKLRLVPGDARRSLRQARDDLRGSDLVIIWGATVLDHATSAPYTQQRELGRLHTVQQRGITSMLGAVVDHLSSSARPRGR